MNFLVGTTEIIELVPGAATSLDWTASWMIHSAADGIPGAAQGNSVATTAITIVPAPSAGTQTQVKHLSVTNRGAAQTVTIQKGVGAARYLPFPATALATGESLVYIDAAGWSRISTTGQIMTLNQSPGAFLKSTFLAAGTSMVVGSTTTKVFAKGAGGGGAGGGATLVAVAAGCGGGGAEGGYFEKFVQGVTPGVTLTYALGAGGVGVSGATGGAGGNTTITINGVLITAFGGPGGIGGASVATAASFLGGAPAAASTNADFNGSGVPGEAGIQFSGLIGRSGCGGGDGAGNSRNTAGAGNAALANSGAGGGGGVVLNGSAAVAGGAGSAGYIIVEEYN